MFFVEYFVSFSKYAFVVFNMPAVRIYAQGYNSNVYRVNIKFVLFVSISSIRFIIDCKSLFLRCYFIVFYFII